MHMADALISPVVGVTMIAVSTGIAAYSIKKIKSDVDQKKIPLMGVMGALIFACQMINFSIPGTGSSGHIGGGLLLASVLGPYAGFLTMSSILIIQALFFADGGLLALGCNIFNLGFFTCFIAYPFIFKKITGKKFFYKKVVIASLIAAVIGLQLGAFSVVIETFLSGRTELSLGTFLLLMQPIHLAIGIVEGLITSAVLVYILKSRPEIINDFNNENSLNKVSIKNTIIVLSVMALITGGVFSWFASTNPDGLEWSIFKSTGKEELESNNKIHESLSKVQEKTSFLPDYSFKNDKAVIDNENNKSKWPDINPGTTTAGFIGSIITLIFAAGIGLIIFIIKKIKKNAVN